MRNNSAKSVQHSIGTEGGDGHSQKTLLAGLLEWKDCHPDRLLPLDVAHLKGGMRGRGVDALERDRSRQVARSLQYMSVGIQ